MPSDAEICCPNAIKRKDGVCRPFGCLRSVLPRRRRACVVGRGLSVVPTPFHGASSRVAPSTVVLFPLVRRVEGENGAQRTYTLSDGVEMSILYNYFYEHDSGDENNYSVCVLFSQGDRHFLFTGDLEEEGEEYLVQYNDLPQVELFKAGHHGSKTSSNDCLLSVIKPKIVCVCCCAGTDEYTDTPENQFPTQAMIDRVSVYTDRVYVTSLGDESAESGYVSMNGNIVVTSNRQGVEVNCSNNNTLLKDTAWFIENRKMPSAWAS